jgi:hypothetical protein
MPYPPLPRFDYYDAPPDAADSALVHFQVAAPTGATAEGLRQLGDDGSAFWLGKLAAYGAPATTSNLSPGRVHPAAGATQIGSTHPDLGNICGSQFDVFSVGAPVQDGTLVTYGTQPVLVTHALGPIRWMSIAAAEGCFYDWHDADATVFAMHACDETELTASSTTTLGARLASTVQVLGPGLVVLPDPRYYEVIDTANPVGPAWPCEPLLAADGVLRCLPSRPVEAIYYSDAACTVPLAWGGTPPIWNQPIGLWRDGKLAIYAYGAQTSPSALYYLDQTCTQVPMVSGLWTLREIPASAFVAVTLGE